MVSDQHPANDDRISRWVLRLIRRMMWLERWSAIVLLAVLVLTMSAQVIARYVFRSPFSWSEELARLAMIWLTFLSASFVMAQRGHITVDVLSGGLGGRFSRRFLRYSDCFVSLIVLVTCLLLLIGGFRFVWYVQPVSSPSLGVPKSLWYGAVSTGLALMAAHSLLNLILQARGGVQILDSEQMAEASNSLSISALPSGQPALNIERDQQFLNNRESQA